MKNLAMKILKKGDKIKYKNVDSLDDINITSEDGFYTYKEIKFAVEGNTIHYVAGSGENKTVVSRSASSEEDFDSIIDNLVEEDKHYKEQIANPII